MSSTNSGLPPRGQNNQSANKRRASKKKKSGFRTFLKTILTIIIIAALLFLGYFGYVYFKVNNMLGTGNNADVPADHSAETKPLTMLLLGTDYRPETKTYLSDVVMVIAMNPKTPSATIVSLPRDTYVDLEGYRHNKLNAYYPIFKAEEDKTGISAEDEMKKMISKYMNVNIDYVTVLNFQAFRDIVDAVGGVTVNVDKDMCYRDRADGTNINLKKGVQTLNGDDALGFVRYRKSNCHPKTDASNDFDRNRRQNEVLHAILDQMKSINGITGIGKVIDAVDQNMKTDIEKKQMTNILKAYWKISKQNVNYVPVTGTWRSPYVYINEDELNKAKQALQLELTKGSSSTDSSSDDSGTGVSETK
ncbi:LCP family protein [Paenibacillus sediminis]|uniref:LCP family protein required for cell wall assembly n=1 Tax=Paenibacillus sediminis TaxID=664909 RepID=A0ABS4GYT4_9BACL|nr:LCP family protein [Paenibacillus sediminis]MBP1935428.1 LCP family protein required for cell wall assembly [Paenibacillus sediminis]